MCSPNILIIVVDIAMLLNKLMHANFVAKDISIDRQLASLPWADKIKPAPDDDARQTATPQEVSQWAQKAFLLLCDLFTLHYDKPSDEHAVKQADNYVNLLCECMSTMHDFKRLPMDSEATKSYAAAISALEQRQWFNLKNDLIVCRNQIYIDAPAPGADGSGTTSFTITPGDSWGAMFMQL